MRFLLVLLLSSGILSAQITDDFSDGDFTTNPVWEGNVDDWTIENGQLRSNGPEVSGTTIYLSTPYTLDASSPIEWSFFVNPKVDPSSNNFMHVYLSASESEVTAANAFYVKVGDTEDHIALYSVVDGTETLLINGIEDALDATNNPYNVKVIYNTGQWTLLTDKGAIGLFEEVGSGTNGLALPTEGFFGVSATYSASNSEKYFFDDLYIGELIVDDTAPEVVSVVATSNNELLVTFSEPITSESANAANFNIAGFDAPEVLYDAGSPSEVVLLFMNDVFPEGESLTLNLESIEDFSGNVLSGASETFSYNTTDVFALLITEVFPDPEPVVGLPEAEYIEIHNATNASISLLDWTFGDATSEQSFGNVSIEAGAYAIVCGADNQSLFEPFGQTIALSSLPSLNNGGDELSIKNAEGKIIHQLAYTDSWYQDALKSSGGWSLEMIDPSNPCGGQDNWAASNNSSGGTPGTVNSIDGENPDTTPPTPLRVLYVNLSNITVEFTEIFPPSTLPSSEQFTIDGIAGPLTLSANPDFLNRVDIMLPSAMEQGVVYELQVAGDIADCSGNTLGETSILPFGVPQEPQALDIVINEILFNPRTGSVDFVELYNHSNKILDLRNLRIANADPNLPEILDNTSIISSDSYVLLPQSYVVLTESTEKVLMQYETENTDAFLDISDLPSYNDDEGVVVLVAFNGVEIDRVHYNEKWHHPLIDDEDGVSLERIDFGLPSDDANSWQSAASNVGYATPGYKNSSFVDTAVSNSSFEVSPPSFSPDDDGFDDFNFLNYKLERDGYSATVKIFNDRGLLIRTLANNELLGASGIIKWDGSRDNGEKATIGKYIWLIELFHPDGEIISEKVVVTLAGFLD